MGRGVWARARRRTDLPSKTNIPHKLKYNWGKAESEISETNVRKGDYLFRVLCFCLNQHPYFTFACVLSLQSCPTLCDSMDCSPPGSSVHGILQARILEWVARPSSRGSSQPRDQIRVSHVSCISRWVLYYQHHLGSPLICIIY